MVRLVANEEKDAGPCISLEARIAVREAETVETFTFEFWMGKKKEKRGSNQC